MRRTRTISAVIASAMLVLLPTVVPASGAPADPPAAPPAHPLAGSRAAADVHVGASIERQGDRLLMVGYVSPAKGPVTISRATHCNMRAATCNFKQYRVAHFVTVDPDRGGRYEVKVETPQQGSWYWQARVGTHKSRIWQTCVTTTGAC